MQTQGGGGIRDIPISLLTSLKIYFAVELNYELLPVVKIRMHRRVAASVCCCQKPTCTKGNPLRTYDSVV